MKNTFYSDLSIDKKYRFNLDENSINLILKFNDKSYSVFRKISTSYANRVYVKRFILNKYNNKCKFCGSKNNLQIDHIISVYKCFLDRNFMICNTIENLQLLCSKCNLKKTNK